MDNTETRLAQDAAVITQTAEQFCRDILAVRQALRGLSLKIEVVVPLTPLGLSGELAWKLIPRIDGRWAVYYRNREETTPDWVPANLLRMPIRYSLGRNMAQQFFIDSVQKYVHLLRNGGV